MRQKQTKLGRAGYAYGKRWIILRPAKLPGWTVLDRQGTSPVHDTDHASLTTAETAIDVWVRIHAHA